MLNLDLFTPDEVAEALSVSPQTLAWWRQKGTGPTYTHVGKFIRLALITNLVVTVVVVVATGSAEAVIAVQAPAVAALGGYALKR